MLLAGSGCGQMAPAVTDGADFSPPLTSSRHWQVVAATSTHWRLAVVSSKNLHNPQELPFAVETTSP